QLYHICGAIAPETYIKEIIRSGAILEKETSAEAAIVTIRRPDIAVAENGPDAQKSAALLKKFHNEICPAFIKAGAVIISCDRETVSAAFGSPLERLVAQKIQKAQKLPRGAAKPEMNPVNSAVKAVKTLFKKASSAEELYAGIDYGECVFSYTPLTRYGAAGSAVFRSRVLSTVARRNKAAALISKTASEKIDSELFRGGLPFDTLNGENTPDSASSGSELYYQLILPE
ncbi:MAG: hypothetical protein LBJ35_04870, partial [Spirochaetaceae bacterium]|nr:hypothetical protein [Spirochaetaceae bacterium]